MLIDCSCVELIYYCKLANDQTQTQIHIIHYNIQDPSLKVLPILKAGQLELIFLKLKRNLKTNYTLSSLVYTERFSCI